MLATFFELSPNWLLNIQFTGQFGEGEDKLQLVLLDATNMHA